MLTLAQMIEKTGADRGCIYQKQLITKKARIAKEEQEIVTIINGDVETTNTAHAGDFIVTGSSGEEYVITKDKFNKLYEEVSEGLYQTKPDEIRAVETSEHISFEAPWGGEMVANPGDFIVYRSETDAYRIERQTFLDTYIIKG